MAIKVARGQVTIIDQNDAVSLQAFIGSSQPLTQVFNKDTGAYAPSWAASPYLILTPSLFVSGKVFPLPAFRLEIVFGRHKRDILRLACA